MLTHPTLDQLHALGLHGMAKGFKELDDNPETRALEHPEWLALFRWCFIARKSNTRGAIGAPAR
jgi:hypothetical protein